VLVLSKHTKHKQAASNLPGCWFSLPKLLTYFSRYLISLVRRHAL
jgi:hypothetical protein